MTDPARAFTVHGGRLDEAARRFPDARDWIDLSTGINPFHWAPDPPPPAELRALPCPRALDRLCRAAAAAFGAPGVPIAAVPGSEIGLRLVAGLGLPRPWRVVTPGYATHRAALPGATPVDAAAFDEETARGGTLLLANPNNPDGRLWPPARLLAGARRLGARGGVLVLDEAFADAVAGASVLPWLAPDDAVLAFRSFGKFFGLAGVRLGFACGHPRLVAALAEAIGSWPVSATALALGTAAYRDAGWIAATRERLAQAQAGLDRLLGAHGLHPVGACPLFRLVDTPRAPALFERLGQAGILVRPFADHPGWLRFGLPDGPVQAARLEAALRGA